ncbi:hypothetical protein ACFL3D_05960 [Candidatus Omnitrophota bacterium]
MKKKFLVNSLLVVLVSLCCGCASFTAAEAELHDEIFSYELPFDKTFMITMDAIGAAPGWTLDETDQMQGRIMARQTTVEAEQVTIVVTRVEKKHVTVELAKESQRVRNVGALLKAIDTALIEG